MKNTFRYILKAEDFCKFYKQSYKKAYVTSAITSAIVFALLGLYCMVIVKNMALAIGMISAVVITSAYSLLKQTFAPQKMAKNAIKGAPEQYLRESEITISDKAIELNNLPVGDEPCVIAIYPFSMMRLILENDEYFYFYIDLEVKILPKRDIPPQMSEDVFRQIRKNKRYVYFK